MRIVFAGTPAIAVPSLRAIHPSHEVVAVLTSPDTQSGRGRQESFSAVKVAALELGLPVLQFPTLDQAAREAIAALKPDILVCFAYGFIFGPRFLALFPAGGINIHPSLLPRFRGPSPLSAAILAGDQQTGISIQRLALEMDAGDILAQEIIPLHGRETTASLSAFCAEYSAGMLEKTLAALATGQIQPRPQDPTMASFCHLIAKEDGKIDWTRPAAEIDRLVRAFDPWPRAFTSWNADLLYILESLVVDLPDTDQKPGSICRVDKSTGILVQTGQGLLALRRLQLQSKKGMDFQSFLNGARAFVGSALGA